MKFYKVQLTENRESFKKHNQFALNLLKPGSEVNTIKVNEYHVLPIAKQHCNEKNLKSIVIPEGLIENSEEISQVNESLSIIESQYNKHEKYYQQAVSHFIERKGLNENSESIDPREYFRNKGKITEQEENYDDKSIQLGKFELSEEQSQLVDTIIESYINTNEEELEGVDTTIHPEDVPEDGNHISDGEYIISFIIPIDTYEDEYKVEINAGFEANLEIEQGETASGGPDPGSTKVTECEITTLNLYGYPQNNEDGSAPYVEIEDGTPDNISEKLNNGSQLIELIKEKIIDSYQVNY